MDEQYMKKSKLQYKLTTLNNKCEDFSPYYNLTLFAYLNFR